MDVPARTTPTTEIAAMPADRATKLSDQAYQAIKRLMFNGSLKSGQFVSQRELVSMAGSSLGPVRETVQRLATEGLIRIIPQRGMQVVEVSPKRLKDAYELRRILEQAAVRRFAVRASDSYLQELRRRHQDIFDRAHYGVDDALLQQAQDVDWELHDASIRALDNDAVWTVYESSAALIRLLCFDRDRQMFGNSADLPSMTEHLAILDACIRRDPDAAEAAVRHHLDTAVRRAIGI